MAKTDQSPLTTKELLWVVTQLGACTPALVWLERKLEENPAVAPEELWAQLLKMKRSPDEIEYDKERRKEEPGWKPDPETHTGWGWLAWVTHRAHMKCSNGTFNGRRKIHDGPNADAVSPAEVLAALGAKWGWMVRGEEEPDDG